MGIIWKIEEGEADKRVRLEDFRIRGKKSGLGVHTSYPHFEELKRVTDLEVIQVIG